MNSHKNSLKDTLYYDGNCALCRHEITWLSKLTDSGLTLIDIHVLTAADSPKPPQELLRLLHLRRADGCWVTGLDATVAAWSHTKLGWLFKPLRWPLIKPVADAAYARWASRRVCAIR